MKLMFVAQEFGIHRENHGGIAHYLYDLCSLILENTSDISISILQISSLASSIDHRSIEEMKIKATENNNQFDFSTLKKRKPYAPSYAKRLEAVLEEAKPDIIECIDYLGFLGDFIFNYSLKKRIDNKEILFITMHHTSLEEILNWGGREKKNWQKNSICHEKLQAFLSDINLFPSFFLKNYVSGKGLIKGNSSVIHSPLIQKDKSQYAINANSIQDKEADKIKILYMGRIEARKCVEKLVESCINILIESQNIELYIVGNDHLDSGVSTRSMLYKNIPLFLNPQVHFFPFIRGEMKDAFFAHSDIFVIPSRYENFSYATMEAVCGHIPVIGSKTSGFIDICGEELAFDYDSNGEDSLENVMRKVLKMTKSEKIAVADKQFSHMMETIKVENTVIDRLNKYRLWYDEKNLKIRKFSKISFKEFYLSNDKNNPNIIPLSAQEELLDENQDKLYGYIIYPNKHYLSLEKKLSDLFSEGISLEEEILKGILFILLPGSHMYHEVNAIEDIFAKNIPVMFIDSLNKILSYREYAVSIFNKKIIKKICL